MAELETNKLKKLEVIKSLYIIKHIFSFLNKKQKLNMLIYNKQLQKKFEVNIRDYKRLSGKYKINGKNGKGSEYISNKDILIFEGEYIKGKKWNRKRI